MGGARHGWACCLAGGRRLAGLWTQGSSRRLHTSALRGSVGAAAGGGEAGPAAAAEGSDCEGEAGEDGEHKLREDILQASLPHVHTLGWSQDAIAQGAESLGYSSMVHGMFPGGGVDLVNHFYARCNALLDESLAEAVKQATDDPKLQKGTTAFLASAVEERLRMNIEYLDTWHRALALHYSPANLPAALHNTGTLVDTIWHHAGDRSHDFNWYTKRGVLAAVYKTTELCMLQDKSQDFQETWAFLGRRLTEVHSVAKCVREGGGLLQGAGSVAKAGILTALNIAGMNSKSRF